MPDIKSPADVDPESVAQVMRASAKPRCMEVTLCGGLYGLDVAHVREVIALRPISRVFHAPPVIAGVVSLRGEVLTVIDVSVLLSGRPSRRGSASRIVVLRDASPRRRLAGLLVDRLGVLRQLPSAGLAPAPSTLPAAAAQLVRGIVPDAPPCSVLDIPALFQRPELLQLAADDEHEH